MKDRLSVHIDNGNSNVREAVTILRNGGTASQSGLVGITNAEYNPSTGSPFLPATILNVQSTGNSNIRFSSGPSKSYRSSLELLGNGNSRSSGLHICYDPVNDNASITGGYYGNNPCVDPGAADITVVDFSLIRPSGTQGVEFSHLSISERGYISLGLTRSGSVRTFEANAPLTISYSCAGHQDSGTISMHEQASSPANHADFGKIYVKPYSVGGRTQALFFKDDGGSETNLVLSQDLVPEDSLDGLIYGNIHGNTHGGWYTPNVRTVNANSSYNTCYGYGAGFSIGESSQSSRSTMIGYLTGSGLTSSVNNTIVGAENLKKYSTATGNVIIGDNNLITTNVSNLPVVNTILIGRNLYENNAPPTGALAIGVGASPLVIGNVSQNNKFLTILDGYFSVRELESSEFKISTEDDNSGPQRDIINLDVIDHNAPAGTGNPARDKLRFNFLNTNGSNKKTLLELDPIGSSGKLYGNLSITGSVVFQDGTSLSGLSYFELIPTFGTSGVNKTFQASNNSSYFTLNYSSLGLAGSVSNNIRTDNTFVAVQLDGTNSSKVGKMSLQGLADYVSSGISSIAENCNVLISNPENELNVNTSANARSVMIGCDVAFGSSGQYNSVIIGSYAGANATISNPTLSTPFSNIFIGPSAGEGSNNTAYAVCIGISAGKNSDSAQDCVFIGNSAGLNSTLTSSVGIGKFALQGGLDDGEGGTGNIEIVAGLGDNQRLFSNPADLALSNRLAINKAIAGRTDLRNISIGDARLTPTAPLEVRYEDNVGHSSNPIIGGNKVLQSWYCNNNMVAYMSCGGHVVSTDGSANSVASDTYLPLAGGTLTGPITGTSNTVQFRSSTTAQLVEVFNTYTSATSLEAFRIKAVAGATYQIGSAIGSAGGTNRAIDIGHWDAAGTFTSFVNVGTTGGLSTYGGIASAKGVYFTSEPTRTPAGTTQTLTLADGNHQTLALTSATGTVTATLTVPSGSSSGTIIVKQHASAAKGITWAVSSGTIKWMGTQPTWGSDAVSSVRLVSWRWDGSVMYLASTDVGT